MMNIAKYFVLTLAICAASSSQVPANTGPGRAPLDPKNTLYLRLKSGVVVIEMLPEIAPKHVARIKELVRAGFYDGLVFHRVIEGFVAQGGDPLGTGYGGTGYGIEAEFCSRDVRRHMRGAVNMARASDPNSADTQFSIMFRRQPHLDEHYTLWGQVLGGMDLVDEIKRGDPRTGKVADGNPDKIISMRIVADYLDSLPPVEAQAQNCSDSLTQCPYWATAGEVGFSWKGECASNRDFMEKHCKLSCGLCPVLKTPQRAPCLGLYKKCDYWAQPGNQSPEGECVRNKNWMLKNCEKQCNPDCKN